MTLPEILKVEQSHIWQREANEHYVEEQWCSQRLFERESFTGAVQDPSCGFGRIVKAAIEAGLPAFGTDLVDRGFPDLHGTFDFFEQKTRVENIVSNPPFGPRRAPLFKRYALHALALTSRKVALIWLTRTLAAARWLERTPLATIYYLTPRPSMPPGHVITRGEKPGGGKQDFCWLVFDHSHHGPPVTRWLRRDRKVAPARSCNRRVSKIPSRGRAP
jgi:hypothetical protein